MPDGPATSSTLALDRLTSAQRDAVTSHDDRLAVFAGAGAGKTRVLTLRVARMVDEGVDPAHILVVTFSRKAAQELRTRLWRLDVEGVRSGTFHRTALELLEVHRSQQGLAPPQLITDRRRMIERQLSKSPATRQTNTGMIADTEISWGKSWGLNPVSYLDAAARSQRRPAPGIDAVAEIWSVYETAKRRQGMLDFDDLIIDATKALEDPQFAAAIHWRSRHVLVDEFQDVNQMQCRLVERLLTPSTSLFCVGDPNQSIYGFNGADPNLLRHLEDRISGTRIITLDANHRSTPEIVEAATGVLPLADQRAISTTQAPGAVPEILAFDDDRSEAAFTATKARDLHGPGGRWRSIAILARTNAQLTIVAEELQAAGIPSEPLAPELRPASDLAVAPDRSRQPMPAATPSDAVALGTFHRAKGLEWPYVIVIGASDGLVPHAGATSDAALDEERRLLYVALTRAERDLTVTWSRRRDSSSGQRGSARRRSPFLDPLERSINAMKATRRPTSSKTGAARVAELRRQLDEARAQRADADETTQAGPPVTLFEG